MVEFSALPNSKIFYFISPENKNHVLVCTLDTPIMEKADKWKTGVSALFNLRTREQIGYLIRDLLANPQIRVIVLDGVGDAVKRDLYAFWNNELTLRDLDITDISEEHVTLLQQYVDIYEDEYKGYMTMTMYSPEPIKYPKKETIKHAPEYHRTVGNG